jgi:stage III sporulation protein AE
MIISLMAISFKMISSLAYETIEKMIDFMKALLPVYIVTVGVSDGQTAATSYYQVALVVITIIEIFCLKILLPAMNMYVVITIINNLHREDYISKICQLIKAATIFAIKGMLTIVTGLNVIRQMFVPINNGIGITTSKNVLGIISGVSGMGNSLAELVYGTGNILKNSIGAAGLVILSVIILIPIVKIIIYIFMYQITNVLLQPVSDKRIVDCMEGVTTGAILLLRIVFSVSLMFVITMAIVCLNNG